MNKYSEITKGVVSVLSLDKELFNQGAFVAFRKGDELECFLYGNKILYYYTDRGIVTIHTEWQTTTTTKHLNAILAGITEYACSDGLKVGFKGGELVCNNEIIDAAGSTFNHIRVRAWHG